MQLSTTLTHVVPLALLAAVSPVMFVNSSRITVAQGRGRGLLFTAGAGAVVVLLGAATMGLMGAATHVWVEQELASRGVDAALGLILIAYGAWQVAHVRRARRSGENSSQASLPTSAVGVIYMGLLGMITNFTTLPLVVSFSQRLGSSGLPIAEQTGTLVGLVAIVLVPCWLPVAFDSLGVHTTSSTHPSAPTNPEAARRKAWLKSVSSWIGIGACFVGGLLVLWHAAMG